MFKLHEAAVEVFWVQEQHRLAVSADLRLARSKDAGARGFQVVTRGKDVFDFVADMVDAARGVLFQKALDWGIFAQGVKKFDLRVRQFDEDDGHTVIGFVLRRADLGPEGCAVLFRGGSQIRDCDGDVVQASDHGDGFPSWWVAGVMGIPPVRGKGQADAGRAINTILAFLAANTGRSAVAGGSPMPMGNGTGELGLQAAVQGMLVPEPGALPLSGVTILLVEDSRFTSDALRLMCQRSGARMRRAETIAAARAHLRTYRPDVVIVDLGLPDGKGEDLISECAGQGMVVVATSGDPAGALSSRRAGASRFWGKPLPGLAVFQGDILSHLPKRFSVVSTDKEKAEADPLALADDLRHALAVLQEPDSAAQRHYLSGFLQGLARSTGDATLREAAHLLDKTGASIAPVQAALSARLNAAGVI